MITIIFRTETFYKNRIFSFFYAQFGLKIKPTFPGKFHRTVATVVHGEVNPKFFGFKDGTLDTPVNFIVNPASNVNSLSLEYPVNYQSGDPGESQETTLAFRYTTDHDAKFIIFV